ncbi:hypothetical protein, partial [Ilumatobacter sp.]|uniref:hypothetical protein n=1 Tax=Ilumatobacter sp. TaxID=1967498 RepID=UPI003C4F46FF
NDLIGEVVVAMGVELQHTLEPVLAENVADHVELIAAVWPVVATVESDAVFALFFEANGLAASGREPYDSLVPSLVEMWIAWASDFIDAPAGVRRVEAETAIAVLDGLLLLRQLAGPEAADRAAERLGVR